MSRLQELRKERGFSQIKMQMLTGIDQSDYSKIETGKQYYTFEQCRVTVQIRTCLKNSILGVFRLVILARRQPSFVFRTKIHSKIQGFQVAEFSARSFLTERGKNGRMN